MLSSQLSMPASNAGIFGSFSSSSALWSKASAPIHA